MKSGETTTRAGVLSKSSTITVPSKTSPPAIQQVIVPHVQQQLSTRFGSTPFSKRADASERNPNSFDVRRTDNPSK